MYTGYKIACGEVESRRRQYSQQYGQIQMLAAERGFPSFSLSMLIKQVLDELMKQYSHSDRAITNSM